MFIRVDDVFIKEFFEKQVEALFKVLDNDGDAHLLAKIKKLFENGIMNAALECLDVNGTDPGSVLSHGDSWQVWISSIKKIRVFLSANIISVYNFTSSNRIIWCFATTKAENQSKSAFWIGKYRAIHRQLLILFTLCFYAQQKSYGTRTTITSWNFITIPYRHTCEGT